MTAVDKMPDVPRNVMPLCSCHLVRLPKNAVFAPKKSVIGSKIVLIFDNFSNFVNHLTWPDHGSGSGSLRTVHGTMTQIPFLIQTRGKKCDRGSSLGARFG